MDFAKTQLEKWGWSEGKGLGKNEQGISTALKPKLKFDSTGLGHDVGGQFTNNWWEKVFNSAAQNINVEVDNKKEIKVKVKDKDAVEISTKNYSVKHLKKNTSLEYGSFIKTAKLTDTGTQNFCVQPFSSANVFEPIRTLTDEELFAACGGRTAHKGARHGLKLSGKLARIEKQEKMQQQEKMLLKKMRKVSLSDQDDVQIGDIDKKLKKLRKHTDSVPGKYTPFSEDLDLPSTSGLSPLKKNKNKKKKRVSFNDNVTKIYVPDLDTSFESEIGSFRDENSNDGQQNNEGSDEGIEKDLENNNNDLDDNHRAFEIARLSFSDLSKEERKKLKKKRKIAAKLNNATGIFLQSVNENSNEEMMMDDDKDAISKKRKHHDYSEDASLSKRTLTEFPDRSKKLKEKRKKNKEKRKEKKKQKKKLEKNKTEINEIVQSLDSVCRISESE